jgi:hypothetical protein
MELIRLLKEIIVEPVSIGNNFGHWVEQNMHYLCKARYGRLYKCISSPFDEISTLLKHDDTQLYIPNDTVYYNVNNNIWVSSTHEYFDKVWPGLYEKIKINNKIIYLA